MESLFKKKKKTAKITQGVMRSENGKKLACITGNLQNTSLVHQSRKMALLLGFKTVGNIRTRKMERNASCTNYLNRCKHSPEMEPQQARTDGRWRRSLSLFPSKKQNLSCRLKIILGHLLASRVSTDKFILRKQ